MSDQALPNDGGENEADEKRVEALMRTIAADAPTPDAAALAELRRRSLDAFGEASVVRRQTSSSLRRAILAIAATAAAVAIGLTLFSRNPASGAPAFGQVIEQLRSAKTLQLRVTKAGHASELLVKAPGLVRRDEDQQHYVIAQGSRLWKIDETTNTAAAEDSPWFVNPKQQVDLVRLLDVGLSDTAPLLAVRPDEQAEYSGRKCFVYGAELPAQEGRLRIVAYVDVQTNQLVGIVARPAGAANAGPPLSELQLVAVNPPVDESKFVVAKSLTDDGRIGKVVDAQGLVTLRPALAQRWTLVGPGTLVKPGDWVRTELRGPNAVKVRLSSDAELTLGPGTLLECISPQQARLHTGESQVELPKADGEKKSGDGQTKQAVAFDLLGPRDAERKLEAGGKTILHVDRDEKLAAVEQTPKWLAGFEGTSANESLGSLIVNLPDGRNEPLSVGYHKVNVEIRDQIARTTIEESFVNHTSGRLEGVFYFPLPQDASISGFGMWIGNDLVEADVVEKQRAREIYETILRERRDPGLLEWTSGNLFKARVFPIEGMSEKRIKIVYTQVLPLRANRYRYSYGLRSELLRTRPLRELSLSVQINSALPLKSVTCPTHSVRAEQTEHSAQVDFAAQEYSPDRDFEVVCEIDGRNSDVVVIPHRRGDDGYFLLQLTPPGRAGTWQREVLPDGKPLQLVLLCDTSASMDAEKRKQQAEFVAAVLASLGEKDRFVLAGADVDTVWAAPEPMAASAENIAKARDFLEQRMSLGWTNLDQAFAAALKQASADAQIIYIGDGIVTAGEADANEFVKKLSRLAGDVEHGGLANRSIHAVTVGNTSDLTVLRGIATVGHGSVRNISGDQTPEAVARELLNEIAQPGLRDVSVEFRGLKVAAVYPQQLPQVPAGTQQILVGRYLPAGEDQQGEVVVSGKLGSEPVKYSAKIDLKDAEAGNSFIPRLWARGHLDYLLQQGQSAAVHDQIIALSEEFHIITPYTSLLVLESDADRERFGVKRRFEMRDGERFFQEGHDNANYELAQQQMKRAGDWRIGLRRKLLRELAGLGRSSQALSQLAQLNNGFDSLGEIEPFSGKLSLVVSQTQEVSSSSAVYPDASFWRRITGARTKYAREDLDGDFGPMDGKWDISGRGALRLGEINTYNGTSGIENLGDLSDVNGPLGGMGGGGGGGLGGGGDRFFFADDGVSHYVTPGTEIDMPDQSEVAAGKQELAGELLADEELSLGPAEKRPVGYEMDLGKDVDFASIPFAPYQGEFNKQKSLEWFGYDDQRRDYGWPSRRGRMNGRFFREKEYQPQYIGWLNTLFPSLAPPPGKPSVHSAPATWSAEALALAKSLMRGDSLAKMSGGVDVRRTVDTFDPRWNRRTSQHRDLALYSPTAWLTRPQDLDAQTIVNYCNAKERGVYSLALLSGRTRKSNDRELARPPLELADWSLDSLADMYRGWTAGVDKAGENQAMLVLTTKPSSPEERFLIDTSRHVVIKHELLQDGKLTSSTEFSDFVEVAGSWWARKVVTTDAKRRKTNEIALEIKTLQPDEYTRRLDAELAAKSQVQFLRLPFVSLKVARQHVADGSAEFDDRITLMLYDSLLQQWDDLFTQLDAGQKLATDKPGVRWIRTIVQTTIRRNEDARQRLLEEAMKLAGTKQPDELFLAEFILNSASPVISPAELLELVELLKPVYDRQPAELNAKDRWQERVIGCYEAAGRIEEALALRHTLAEKAPWDLIRQIEYSRRLAQLGRYPAAYEWLQKQSDRKVELEPSEDEQLRSTYADMLRGQARWGDVLEFTTGWIKRNPPYDLAYQQHLSALIYNDKQAAADELVEQWLKDGRVERKLQADERARLNAAIAYAQGGGYNLWSNQIDERWLAQLADTARYFARHKDQFEIAVSIANGNNFWSTEEGDRFRGYLLNLLRTELDRLSPQNLEVIINWSLGGRIELTEPIGGRKQLDAAEVPNEIWEKIADRLRDRWVKAEDNVINRQLGDSLRTIYVSRFTNTKLLPFLRERLAAAPAELKGTYTSALFEALVAQKWSEEIEQEAFKVLRILSDTSDNGADNNENRLAIQVPALYRLDDAMITGRQARAMEELKDQGKLDQLTRTELAKKRREFATAAQTAVADRLAAEAAKDVGPLTPWLRIEQAYLDVQLDGRLPDVEKLCWEVLGEAPPKPNAAPDAERSADATISETRREFLDAILRQRAFTTAMNLAARRNALPSSIERLTKYIDAGMEQGGDSGDAWRSVKFQLLVALDRPDDLEKALRQWIRTSESTAAWRRALAYLLAERGQLDEAISLFEAAEKDQLLTAPDYRALSDWYLVRNRRDAYEKARVESFKQLPAQFLANLLYGQCNRWSRNDIPLPSELDENTLFAIRALFEKMSNPEGYLWQVSNLYAACRDFRLLDMLPDTVLGRSPQQIYPFLETAQSSVLAQVQNEAPADEILARIKKLRERELSTTDLRALDLLEAMVERRSAEVLNQPGPHVQACLAALRRAFDRKWSDGEPRLMASFLNNLDRLPKPELVDEQMREFQALQALVPGGSRDHLHITNSKCNLLFTYDRHDVALDEMETEVRSYEQANKGRWPFEDDDVLDSYVQLLQRARRYAAGEAVLRKWLAKPDNDQQRQWLDDRLLALFNDALENDGEVSLGKGNGLFESIVADDFKRLDTASDENVRHNFVARLVNTFEIGRRKNFASTKDLLRKFAFEIMPSVLAKQQAQYRNTVTMPMNVIGETLGPTFALQYAVEQMEQFPKRFQNPWEDAWGTFGAEIARRREESAAAKLDIHELEPRVLELSIAELKHQIRTGEGNNQHIFYIGWQWFWTDKADDFARAAEEVLAERKNSGRRAMSVANYLWNGLHRFPRAIEILLLAHRDGLLDEGAQEQLVRWLQEQGRFAESIAILEPLVRDHVDSMQYRTQLMVAYFRSQRPDQLREIVQQIESHFHADGRWTEGSVAEFSKACQSCEMYQKAVGYLNEAISLHQRSQGGVVINDAGLSDLYQQLADAQAALGNTKEAVDAASAAIVCWGPRQQERKQSLERLNSVLARAKDLPAYVKQLDEESAKTGQDSPILRKAIGQVYLAQRKHAHAAEQFELSAQLQPNDKEVYEALIACYSELHEEAQVKRQFMRLIDADHHNLSVYERFADRLKDSPAEAERAITSLIEAGATEAENHAALAEFRQKQGRWDEAIDEWTDVAKRRSLEPTGLEKLAAAQIHQKQWDAAKQSIEKLQRTGWPSRFSDVNEQARRLQEQLPK